MKAWWLNRPRQWGQPLRSAPLSTPSLLKLGTTLTVTNGFSTEAEQFRVVWIAEQKTDGRWDTGIEAVTPREDFWGIRFPPSKNRKA